MIESASAVIVLVQRTQDRVVLQQVRQRLGVGKIVGRDKLDIVPVQTGAEYIPADAAEAIDAYFDCHFFSCVDGGLR